MTCRHGSYFKDSSVKCSRRFSLANFSALIARILESRKTEEQKEGEKKEARKQKEARSKEVIKKVKREVEPDLDACRQAIKEHKQKMKEENPPEPKPKKTRITKLHERLLSLVALIPDEHKEDTELLDKTEKILLDTLHKLTNLWGMSRTRPAEKAIEERFDKLEGKIKTKLEKA